MLNWLPQQGGLVHMAWAASQAQKSGNEFKDTEPGSARTGPQGGIKTAGSGV
jgi:hypothetical protein